MSAESSAGKWERIYASVEGRRAYGEPYTYAKGADFLGDLDVEDWGCGLGWYRNYARGAYLGIDGSPSRFADVVEDLRARRSRTDGLFMRHVLEHELGWRVVLDNALASFQRRMVLVIYTPFGDETRVLRDVELSPGVTVPEISFAKEDLLRALRPLLAAEERVASGTVYGLEHVFYLTKGGG